MLWDVELLSTQYISLKEVKNRITLFLHLLDKRGGGLCWGLGEAVCVRVCKAKEVCPPKLIFIKLCLREKVGELYFNPNKGF